MQAWPPPQSQSTANAGGLQEAGGPRIPARFGRIDVEEQTGCAREGRLPGKACAAINQQ